VQKQEVKFVQTDFSKCVQSELYHFHVTLSLDYGTYIFIWNWHVFTSDGMLVNGYEISNNLATQSHSKSLQLEEMLLNGNFIG